MNAGQITGSASIVLGLAAQAVPVNVLGFPCGPAAYAAATSATCRPGALPWVLIGVVLVVGGAFIAAAAHPGFEPGSDKVPWVEAVAWLTGLAAVCAAIGFVVLRYGFGSA